MVYEIFGRNIVDLNELLCAATGANEDYAVLHKVLVQMTGSASTYVCLLTSSVNDQTHALKTFEDSSSSLKCLQDAFLSKLGCFPPRPSKADRAT